MKDPLVQLVKNFLLSRVPLNKPLLIGYSGGPDSKALLYLLLESGLLQPLQLHVAHVDHGWRKESQEEAQTLRREVEGLGLPWHLETLSLSQFFPGNLEEQARCKRLDFFFSIYQKLGAQALLLGHQADDQAEVILKRLFEGASLFALRGMEKESVICQNALKKQGLHKEGMVLWRPLISIPKKKLVAWVEGKKLSYVVDLTNTSPDFLRGRMRQDLLPFLSNVFGKQIGKNLCFLGEEAQQLKEFFSPLNQPILEGIIEEAGQKKLDLTPHLPLPLLQVKYLIKECLHQLQAGISREMLDEIARGVQSGNGCKRFFTKSVRIKLKNHLIEFDFI